MFHNPRWDPKWDPTRVRHHSNVMEREGFKRCMENIQGKGAKVKVVATDRHVSIKSDMKCIYPDVDHQFDAWHLAKSH